MSLNTKKRIFTLFFFPIFRHSFRLWVDMTAAGQIQYQYKISYEKRKVYLLMSRMFVLLSCKMSLK